MADTTAAGTTTAAPAVPPSGSVADLSSMLTTAIADNVPTFTTCMLIDGAWVSVSLTRPQPTA